MPYQASYRTKGGFWGHCFRRSIHVSMIFIPCIYIFWGLPLAAKLHVSGPILLAILWSLVVGFEVFRLYSGLLLWGHRPHEKHTISSFAWGFTAIVIILVFASGAPKAALAVTLPLVGACALGDPLIGELRVLAIPRWLIYFLAYLVVLGLWLLSYFYFHIPFLWVIVVPPIAIASESIRIRHVDDNALMMLIPFFVVRFIL